MTSKENCASLLANGEVQQRLVDVFAFYFDDLQEIVHFASAERDGKRPDNLSNEIYSCFHHMARGLCASSVASQATGELDKAIKSHLRRANYDAYKLAINSFLGKHTKLKEILDYLVLIEDFEKYVPEGLDKINRIDAISEEAREEFRLAKRDESLGNFSEAVSHYSNALDKGTDLSEEIRAFTNNKTYLLACAREARERKEKRKDRSSAMWAAIISAVVSAILTAACTVAVQNYFPDREQAGESVQTRLP